MDKKKTNEQLPSLVATFFLTGGSLNRGLEIIRLRGQGHCPLQRTLCWVPWPEVWRFGPCNVLLMWETSFIFTTTILSAPLGSFAKNTKLLSQPPCFNFYQTIFLPPWERGVFYHWLEILLLFLEGGYMLLPSSDQPLRVSGPKGEGMGSVLVLLQLLVTMTLNKFFPSLVFSPSTMRHQIRH